MFEQLQRLQAFAALASISVSAPPEEVADPSGAASDPSDTTPGHTNNPNPTPSPGGNSNDPGTDGGTTTGGTASSESDG